MASLGSGVSRAHDELDRRERKRLQNRMAQRVYRRNQKQRLQALEAAVANATSLGQITPPQETEETRVDASDHGPAENTSEDPSWDILQDVSFPEPPSSRTALERAVCGGRESMARLLIEHGADLMRADAGGKTALHLAAEYGDEGMMRLVLSHARDLNTADYLGRTALFYAVQNDNRATAEVLLEASPPGFDINWKDGTGTNALHLAVECGFEAMARLLLAHGADVNA